MIRDRWQSFLQALDEARRRHPAWFRSPDAAVPMSTSDVAGVEVALGVSLPPEVMWLLTEIGPGDLGFARIYGANQTPFDDLRVVDGFLVFADNGCGDLYGLPLAADPPRPISLRAHDDERWEPSGHDDLVEWLRQECIRGIEAGSDGS